MDSQEGVQEEKITKRFFATDDPKRLLLGIVITALVLGTITGYILSARASKLSGSPLVTTPKTPEQDTRTFRDFAEGVIKPRPQPSDPEEYVEGTHFLEREGAVPVALTSSVVDLTQYEGKKVKIFGETQKAIKEGWLMDVGKIEEVN